MRKPKKPAAAPRTAVSYTNRMGVTYYLHEGRTKTGNIRYHAAKTVREGVLFAMPDGYELTESINAVVSVSKVNTATPAISEQELEIVRAELARHPHLRLHRAEVAKGELVVYEPGTSVDAISELSRTLGVNTEWMEARLATMVSKRYSPVMKFVPAERPGEFAVHRMTYSGKGGWSWELAVGALRTVAKRYLAKVGTDDFFELM